jgi:hypothetical protein
LLQQTNWVIQSFERLCPLLPKHVVIYFVWVGNAHLILSDFFFLCPFPLSNVFNVWSSKEFDFLGLGFLGIFFRILKGLIFWGVFRNWFVGVFRDWFVWIYRICFLGFLGVIFGNFWLTLKFLRRILADFFGVRFLHMFAINFSLDFERGWFFSTRF